jgi:hypothetical protein
MFAMGMFLLQDGIHAKFDSIRARFFWEGTGPKRMYHMINWPAVCLPREVGGLGILNTKKMNIALMLKWVWKLHQDDDSIWARLIRAKYTDTTYIFSYAGQGGSPFWKSLHQIKDLFKIGAKNEIKDGHRTQLWYDKWHVEGVLRDRFPLIFSICENTRISVAQTFLGQEHLRLRRTLGASGRA